MSHKWLTQCNNEENTAHFSVCSVSDSRVGANVVRLEEVVRPERPSLVLSPRRLERGGARRTVKRVAKDQLGNVHHQRSAGKRSRGTQ
jgi:hypothetical protein